MLLHLQLGHANIHKLKAAQEQYGTNKVSRTNPNGIPYCRPITSTDVIYCAACHTAKAKKIALPSKPSRTLTGHVRNNQMSHFPQRKQSINNSLLA
jgi:hypothetical protein